MLALNALSTGPAVLNLIAWFIAAYLLGSIPEAWLLARLVSGQDLRKLGSGNIGVMNTAISVTRWAGLLVFLSEIAKGALAVLAPSSLKAGEYILGVCVLALVIGVRWPVWLRFRGGRGNTAGMAAFALISYLAGLITLAFWVLARLLLKDSFKATRLSIIAMPFIVAMVTRSWLLFFTFAGLGLIYLAAQQPESDDHTTIKGRWSGLFQFIASPPRR